jgi:alkanesulfonate monooxygenase SsuD/methylene tetrahydromethanopterin reductase-like flavin-dependent oxidoreductase (luciferase family)
MQIGQLSSPVTRAAGDTRPLKDLYSDAIDRVCQLEQDGFDYFQAGEHHFTENQWNPCPLEILAAIAMRTSILRLGTNVLLTPLYHPMRLAEEAATIDLLSNGRLNLVCGSGSSEFEVET